MVDKLRLYETLGAVAESLPVDLRRDFVTVTRGPAFGIPDRPERARLRGRVYRATPVHMRDQFRWILATLRDRGAYQVWTQWVCDAGHARSSSS